MNQLYLSPAFSKRRDEEKKFLFNIDGATGFSLFWIDVTRPLLHEITARNFLQIGAYKGEHAQHILKYYRQVDGVLTIIGPVITPDLEASLAGASYYKLIVDKSMIGIP